MDSQWNIVDNGDRILVNSEEKQSPEFLTEEVEASRKLSMPSDCDSSLIKLGKRKRKHGCKPICKSVSKAVLLKNYSNFMKSGPPSRLLFHHNGDWNDFPKDILELVRDEFRAKKVAINVQLNDGPVVLDILYMVQVDQKTGSQKPIAWIDEAGSCYFPEICHVNTRMHDHQSDRDDEDEIASAVELNGANEIKLHLEININGVNGSNLEECVEESNVNFKRIKFEQESVGKENGLSNNDEHYSESIGKLHNGFGGNNYFDDEAFSKLDMYKFVDVDAVRNMFLMAMKPISNVTICQINKCSNNFMQMRLELFEKQYQITKKYRGNSNVRYAWLPCPKNAVSSFVAYGLGHDVPEPKTKYGVGVHLIDINSLNARFEFCLQIVVHCLIHDHLHVYMM